MEIELKEFFNVLKKRIWLIVAIVVVVCLATAANSYFFTKPIYQASTKLIVNKSSNIQGVERLDFSTLQANLQLIDTYKDIISTPAILDKVAENYPEIGLNSDQLSGRIQVISTKDSQVMTIITQDYSQERAAKIVNAVATVFKDQIPSIMKVDNVAILSEAKPDKGSVPVNKSPTRNIAVALLVSLLVSVGLAFFLEYLDDSIKSEKDIEQFLGVPMLAGIAIIKESDLKHNKRTNSQRSAGDKVYATVNQ